MDRARQSKSRQSAKSAKDQPTKPTSAPAGSWTTFLLAAGSALMLWAALPPLGWWPLAWVAPVAWLWLAQMDRMPGRWPYLAIWLAAFLHWLAVVQGVRLGHPILYAGWIALAWYLAFYPTLFILLTRLAVRKCSVPLVLAAPTTWVALEWLRGHAITGFSAALLGHTQYEQLTLIQLSDTLGAYGVSFLVMLVAAALASGLPWRKWLPALGGAAANESNQASWGTSWRMAPLATAIVALAASLGYGGYRLSQHEQRMDVQQGDAQPVRIALLQENVETIFDYNRERSMNTFRRYLDLAQRAVEQQPQVDILVWPESAFNSVYPIYEFAPGAKPPADTPWTAEEFERRKPEIARSAQLKAESAAYVLGEQAAMLAGSDVYYFADQVEHYNSAVLYSPEGKLLDRYGKMHRVMFGEYIPLGDQFPWLYSITPMASGLTAGRQPEAFQWDRIRMAPNICFESVVPHLIRRHVNELAQRGETPDVLVNITNDGWFRGSSILDLHRICGVFRAVENRRPLLIAANIGLSCEIESSGRIVQQLPRGEVGVIHAQVFPIAPELSLYTRWGDWFAGLCATGTLLMLGITAWRNYRN